MKASSIYQHHHGQYILSLLFTIHLIYILHSLSIGPEHEVQYLATMRLTVDLINNSLSYLNPLKERELDLRGAYRLKGADTTL